MFYFDSLNNKKILRSDRLKINAFFTTRGWNSDDFLTLAPKVITPNQTHSDNVRIVNSSSEYPDTDGLIIAESNTLVYLRFADCTPIIFYDSVNKGYNETDAISKCGGNTYQSKTDEEMDIIKNKIRETKLGAKNPMARKVKRINIKTNEVDIFDTVIACAQACGIKNGKTSITTRLSGQIKSPFKNTWMFEYYEE